MPKRRTGDRHRSAPYQFRPSKEQENFIQWFMVETGLTRSGTLRRALVSLVSEVSQYIYHDSSCCNGTQTGKGCPGRIRQETINGSQATEEPDRAQEQETDRPEHVQPTAEGTDG